MRILALETATRRGSWALLEDGVVVAAGEGGDERSHAEQLPRAVIELLASRGLALADVDAFAVATGPGSFTGLRIGIATAQGFAMATGKPVIPVPTLDAIAEGAAAEPGAEGLEYIAVWLDGQRREIFAALYALRRRGEEGSGPVAPALLMPPQSAAPAFIAAEIADLIGDAHAGFAGDGAHRYKAAIDTLGLREARLFSVKPIAPDLGRLADRRRDTAVRPHAVAAVYVRRPDAEAARDRAPGKT
ncbi:MAG TPA: tRNA (adenosine(37)-N6)-threonylcarbamoyltransferase complex dimerization subunit type 1 TsaB [Vicinamibacterales bacterium]|nr:tRNA (adenosine(37)-N6)-threonylcarbamoyltransferase complex dimerization subunit type 1 TsaB [Vicinamibacterales bacterium]